MRPIESSSPWPRRMRERGATSAEYALIAGLIAVVIVTAVAFFGSSVAASWSDSADQVESATTP